ncbi:MBL fold metallo-hydrolase [Mycobacteroides chelonae]|jgi:glyoxylase-like metal-dependent hydrolase (beta-lactamase superfamily II)|uniref:MBL fold metallo-hydrolase n=1 Tax=Mycobacteroides chelonae TaxID=1774 RepID=UPI0008A8B6F8|nr:MBL fold metallo-hydrolase [Mycobacteroides chelonae]MBF9326619.1 MBL fold metallo-hydrolase [Mycobacteroides chelonae]MBF9420796.1 MBL fold metallo-hydrolase [Mycobacteroides chelonae]MBF9437013.1 MBL fold metallo-hydrolase [Mycobacteroides chelonae]MBV6360698.1 MBL fold metallo-hydrolase [Mycobacteroides chelonae]MEC4833853.1 MBL fold metallo-hydrolase [Mycobacteroides chelonae]
MTVVYVLDVGTLRPLGGGDVPTQCLVIERPEGLLAVDAGLSRALLEDPRGLSFERFFIRPPKLPALALVNQIQALGYRPGDLTDIVLTHLHSEHAAGIMDFPSARIHVAKREFDIAHDGSVRSRISYRRNIWAHGPRWELHSGAQTWNGIQGVSAISADVLLVPLPGHTLGHCGIAVRTAPDRWLLHAGDATYSTPARSAGESMVPPSFPLRQYQHVAASDRTAAVSSRNHLERIAKLDGVDVMCSHKSVAQVPLGASLVSAPAKRYLVEAGQ